MLHSHWNHMLIALALALMLTCGCVALADGEQAESMTPVVSGMPKAPLELGIPAYGNEGDSGYYLVPVTLTFENPKPGLKVEVTSDNERLSMVRNRNVNAEGKYTFKIENRFEDCIPADYDKPAQIQVNAYYPGYEEQAFIGTVTVNWVDRLYTSDIKMTLYAGNDDRIEQNGFAYLGIRRSHNASLEGIDISYELIEGDKNLLNLDIVYAEGDSSHFVYKVNYSKMRKSGHAVYRFTATLGDITVHSKIDVTVIKAKDALSAYDIHVGNEFDADGNYTSAVIMPKDADKVSLNIAQPYTVKDGVNQPCEIYFRESKDVARVETDGDIATLTFMQPGSYTLVCNVSAFFDTNVKDTRRYLYFRVTKEGEEPVPDPEPDPGVPVTAKVTGNRVNLREGAGNKYAVIEQLPSGATVEIIEQQAKWANVLYTHEDGTTVEGFVSGKYLTAVEPNPAPEA